MAIKEKPRDLEFTYEDDNGTLIYDVKFLEESGMVFFNGIGKGEVPRISFEVKVLAEIVDFLREQDAIEGGSPKRPRSFGESLLPLPVIETKNKQVPIMASLNHLPLSSFDIKGETLDGENEEVLIDTTKKPKESTVTKKVNGGIVIDNLTPSDSDIPERAVIRTRIRDVDDPLGAEKDAAEMRGSGKGAKEIKRY